MAENFEESEIAREERPSKRIRKTDMGEVGEEIDQQAVGKNVCFFYAIFNSLRTREKRLAFSANNLDAPHEAFVSMFENRGEKIEDRIKVEGYNTRDIKEYLDFLKERDLIKSYKWVRFHDWRLTQFLCSSKVLENAFILQARRKEHTFRPWGFGIWAFTLLTQLGRPNNFGQNRLGKPNNFGQDRSGRPGNFRANPFGQAGYFSGY